MEHEISVENKEQSSPSKEPPDRRGRIKAMGVIQIVLGGIITLILLIMILGLLLGRAIAESAGTQQPSLAASLASTGVYVIAAVFFFVVGIGSLKLRRWVRPVILAFMWPSLIFGVAGFVFGVTFLPTVFGAMPMPEGPDPALQRAVMSAMAVVVNVVLFVACVVIPAIHVLIYQPGAIRETLEHFDTTPRFTDKCPTPVFGIVVSLKKAGVIA
jgi:hypothetical protein